MWAFEFKNCLTCCKGSEVLIFPALPPLLLLPPMLSFFFLSSDRLVVVIEKNLKCIIIQIMMLMMDIVKVIFGNVTLFRVRRRVSAFKSSPPPYIGEVQPRSWVEAVSWGASCRSSSIETTGNPNTSSNWPVTEMSQILCSSQCCFILIGRISSLKCSD